MATNFATLSKVPVYKPKDVYAIVNQMMAEISGGAPQIQAVDTSSFIQVGQMALNMGTESTLGALLGMIGRTFIAIRPYRTRFASIEMDTQNYGMIQRKISYFSGEFGETTSWNTDRNPDQLFDGKSVDMYTIHKQYPLQMFFGGFTTLQRDFTTFRDQLKIAFTSESEFSDFYQGLATQVSNEIEMLKDVENRMVLLNHMGALYNSGNPEMAVNLTARFNAERGTTYTSEQLRTTHLQEFLSFLVSFIQIESDLMTENSELFHLTPKCTDDGGHTLKLWRHTPKNMQKLLLYAPLMAEARSWVYPAIFGPGYLTIDNYESVNYWQNIRSKAGINVTPAQFDVNTGAAVTGETVTLPYVVGLLFDRDAVGTTYMQSSVDVTPFNTRGKYWNTTYNWVKGYKNDLTENAILLYMAD